MILKILKIIGEIYIALFLVLSAFAWAIGIATIYKSWDNLKDIFTAQVEVCKDNK